MTYRFMMKYLGFTAEELNLYESLTNDAERINFKKTHSHSFNYEVIIETILSFLFKVINSQKGQKTDEIKHYAQLELQMLATKLLAFSVLLQKWGAHNIEKDIILNPIVDPIVLGGLTRSIYEVLGVFRLVYLLPDDDEKKMIAFNLWKRHSFLDNIKEVEAAILLNIKKGYRIDNLQKQLQFAKEQCDKLLNDILKTNYASVHHDFDFDRGNSTKSLIILDDNPKFVSLSNIGRNLEYYIPLKNLAFQNMYKILSHFAHLSHQAEEQFDNDFSGSGNNSKGPYPMIVSFTAILAICFISSYIVYDKSIKNELNEDEVEIFNVIYNSFCLGKFGLEPSIEEYTQERMLLDSL